MTKYYIGIDPGLSGAFAILEQNDGQIKINVHDTPVCHKMSGGKKSDKKEMDIPKTAAILRQYDPSISKVCLEFVHAMPGQGSVSNFSFGKGLGNWEGVIKTLGFDLEYATPQSWKKEYGDELIQHTEKPEILKMTVVEYNKSSIKTRNAYDIAEKEFAKSKRVAKEQAKDAARMLASRLYPDMADQLVLKKHDGRAEAILIAERIRRKYQ